jgi:AraC-like DNA-binding protein
MSPTSLASASRILWRMLKRNGVDPGCVFREARLDPALMDDPRGRYPIENVRAAWLEGIRLIPDPCFGLQAAGVWRPTDFHALGYAFLASRTLRIALERIVRYNTVVDPVIHFRDELDDRVLRLTYHSDRPDLPDPPVRENARWAAILGMCREIYGSDLDPIEAAFTHDAPSCRGDFFGLFRCSIHFNAPVSRLVFDRAQMERPLPADNQELALASDGILRAYVDDLQHDGDLISRVKAAVIDHLPSGAPSAELIAKDLYLSPRTLQRRLAEENISYSRLLETVRRELAEQYVSDPARSLSEISFLLGFSELSAFSRAFKRWTGQAPGHARQASTA